MSGDKDNLELRKSIIKNIIGCESSFIPEDYVRMRSSIFNHKSDKIVGLVIATPEKNMFSEKVVSGNRSWGKVKIGEWGSVSEEDFLEFAENIQSDGNICYFDIIWCKLKLVCGPDITRKSPVLDMKKYRGCRESRITDIDKNTSREVF